jgi:UDP-N-acetylmuramyl pentapeptide phosphotransferase/UDP-N-acetylglucosamine-1-phosphate transferase
MKLAGVILMLVGVAALIYGGFSYTTHKKAVDVGPIQVESTHHHHVPLPPILGVAFLVGGALVYYGGRSRA